MDDASPFAMLLASTASKAAKPPQGDAKGDAQDSDIKDDQAADAASTPDAAPPVKTAAKPAKDDADTDDVRKDDKSDAIADAGSAPTADAAPDMAMVQPPAPQAAVQPPVPQAVQQTDTEETVGDVAAAQGPAAPQAGQPGAAPQAAAPQTTGPQAAVPQDVAPQDDTAKPAAAKPVATGKPANNDTRTDPAKSAARKTAIADAKADSADDLKTDAAKAAAPQVASDAPAKPAPQTAAQAASQANANVTAAAPLAGTPASAASAPAITQHVQVSAEQPAPNMPALAVQIVTRSQSGARQFDIRLDPPELGHVEVRLSIDATGKASAHVSADQPQTLDLLQKDSTSLTRALREAGLDVSQDGLNFSLRQQGQQAGQDRGDAPALSRRGALSLTATKAIDATTTSATWRSPADGRLDIRV